MREGGAYRRKDRGGDQGVVHLLGTLPVETRRQQLSDLAAKQTVNEDHGDRKEEVVSINANATVLFSAPKTMDPFRVAYSVSSPPTRYTCWRQQ